MASVSGTRGFIAMRLSILGSNERRLAQGAAIHHPRWSRLGLQLRCDAVHLRDSDGMFTGSTTNQRQIIAPNQPYPGDSVPAAAVDGSHTGSIAREAVKPVDLSPSRVSHRCAGAGRRHHGCGRRLQAAASRSRTPMPAPAKRPRQDRHRNGRTRRLAPRAIRSAGRAPAARRSPPRKARPSTICRAASACLPTC